MELDSYRRSAETFVSQLTGEYYRHYAGLKDSYEIEPIYEQHRQLFTSGAVEWLRDLAASAPASEDDRRRLTMLLDFAVQGYVGEATKSVESELARREAGLSIEVDGQRLGFRESSVVQANEADAARRAAIEHARVRALDEHLGSLYREQTDRQHHCAAELGWDSYREMCEQSKLLDLDGLRTQTESFIRATESPYPKVLEPELRRTLGLGFSELARSDLPRFFRAADKDALFPADRLLPSFVRTMQGLGIDVQSQPGVVLDVEARPKKSPRAFCAPVRSPGEVYLVLTPVGGWDDFSALFHEGGHTEHFANVDPGLPFEFRYLGDNSITEAFAFLLQHLVEDPEWLRRRLGVIDASPLVSHARAQRLVYLRRYAGKLAYELVLHGPGADSSLAAMADRYSELLGAAVGVAWPRETYLADVDPGFYCACYLRAWALETHLRRVLRDRFGVAWFNRAEAGNLLKQLWREGQRITPEELLGRLGAGEELDFGVMVDDLQLNGSATA
jgi:hypothetical protein